MGEIIVGVDGSPAAAHALQWAAREAARHGSSVTAVLAWGYLDQHGPDRWADFDPHYHAEDAEEALNSYVRGAVGEAAASTVARRAVCDLAARALLDQSEGAELLVVGARGRGGFSGLLLGSVSDHCTRHARCPIAVVRGDHPVEASTPMRRIVVGVDGSHGAQRALGWALAEARAHGADLTAVAAWHPPLAGGVPFAPILADSRPFEDAARIMLDGALADADTTDVRVERLLVDDGAARALLDEAKEADLLVVGSRGLGGFAGLLLGSVGRQVANHAPCPVVIVPEREA
jgi:nucleotide-binding universal stress UspA family protein